MLITVMLSGRLALTSTPSIIVVAGMRATRIPSRAPLAFRVTVSVLYPTHEKMTINSPDSPGVKASLNEPSFPHNVPLSTEGMNTVAPATPTPVVSVTIPEMTFICPLRKPAEITDRSMEAVSTLMAEDLTISLSFFSCGSFAS